MVSFQTEKPKEAFAFGYWFGFGYFACGLSWIGNALLIDAQTFGWLYPLVFLASGAFFGLFGQLVDHCLHGNSLLLGFLLVQRVTKKLRPALPFGKGDEAVNFTPRYHPVSALFYKERRSNAVTGRTVPHEQAVFSRSRGPLRSELRCTSLSEALSAGEASLFAGHTARTFSVAAFLHIRFS